MKLSTRLSAISSMVSMSEYDHIWDTCCDHGHLGFNLIESTAAHIHFVDIVQDLTDTVESTLSRYFSDELRWSVQCLDVAELPIDQFDGRQLVVIAGVGGDLMLEFVQSLSQKFAQHHLEFLLCPVHHHFLLRTELIKLGYGLVAERLVEDNKRFYELIHVTNLPSKELSSCGTELWQCRNDLEQRTAQKYLAKTIGHYQRVAKGTTDGSTVLEAYQAIGITRVD